MSVRLTGGRYSGRRLFGPPRLRPFPGVRPTAARLRKSLFEVLAEELPGASVLDLCAGVGTLGFEALSRGAGSALFLERDPRLARLIEQNAERLGAGPVEVRAGDAGRELRRLAAAGSRFGLVFLDPPWDSWESGAGERLLAAAARLAPAVVAAEHRSSFAPPEAVPGPVALFRLRTTAAGDGAFSLYRPAAPEQPGVPLHGTPDEIRPRFVPFSGQRSRKWGKVVSENAFSPEKSGRSERNKRSRPLCALSGRPNPRAASGTPRTSSNGEYPLPVGPSEPRVAC